VPDESAPRFRYVVVSHRRKAFEPETTPSFRYGVEPGSGAEQGAEAGFVEDGDAEGFGFGEF
jgi:hypothetical protein